MKLNGLRWFIVSLIAIATVINYIDRNALAVMWPEIPRIGATKEDYALLVTVFMLFYAAGQFVFGRLFDIIGTRLGFALSIAVWSVSIALHSGRPLDPVLQPVPGDAGHQRGRQLAGRGQGERRMVPRPASAPWRRASSTPARRSARSSRRR